MINKESNPKNRAKIKRLLQGMIVVVLGALLFKIIFAFIETEDPFDSALFYSGIIIPTVVLGLFAGWFSDIPVSLWWVCLALGVLSMTCGNLWPLTLILLLVMFAPSAFALYLSRIAHSRITGERQVTKQKSD